MITRRTLRLALLLVAAAIGGVVWWQWRPVEAMDEPTVELEVPEDREIASRSEALQVTQSANGLLVFELAAAEQVDFVDGWNVYDDVQVRIPTAETPSEEEGAPLPDTGDPCGEEGCIRIRADTLRASGRVPNFDELRFIGNVSVSMPGGLDFETRRLDYDPVTGVVSNCNRNELRYAGLDVRADCLRFETGGDVARDRRLRARELEMWGDLVVQTSEDASTLPAGLRGGAERMRFLPSSEEVSLLGTPQLDLERARILGEEIFLTLAGGARRLESVRASGDARLDWSPPTTEVADTAAVADAPGTVESGSEDASEGIDGVDGLPETGGEEATTGPGPVHGGAAPPRQRLRGDVVLLELGEGGSETVTARGRAGDVASLEVEDTGRLQAREISVVGTAGRARIGAGGRVVWRSDPASSPVPRLDAGTLVMRLGAQGLRGLEAAGEVVAQVAATEGPTREFRGDRLELEWDREGALSGGGWPEGVTFGDGDRTLQAARARRASGDPAWVLDGRPRPRVRDLLFELEADELQVDDSGSLEADGEVVGEIDAGSFGAGAALFGDVARVRVQAEGATLEQEGGLRLREEVRVLWRQQSLLAERLLVVGDPGRLQASGDVELVVDAGEPLPDEGAADGDEADLGEADGGRAASTTEAESATPDGERGTDSASPRRRDSGLLIAMAAALLVDGDPAEIRLAGEASVEIGDRRITSERIVISPGQEGGWRRFSAEEDVEFEAPLGTGSGVRMEYDLDRQELVLEGDEDEPARFELAGEEDERTAGRDVSPRYESSGALRIRWLDETVEIAAIEDGRTRTSVVPRQDQGRPDLP